MDDATGAESALGMLWARIQDGSLIAELVGLAVVFAVAFAVFFVVNAVLVRGVRRLARSTDTSWDDEMVKAGVFRKLAWLAPLFVLYSGWGFFPSIPETAVDVLRRLAVALMVLVGAQALTALLNAAERIYDSNPEYRERSIKSYVQVVSILIYLIAGLLVLSALMNRSPWIFVSGIGAMTAILLLVFRDTILSFVASIQIAGNDMVRVGDWIEMPGLGVDGDVIEVALHTVKVQNWDKTIVTIPTHKLISDSFKNWRGMSQSGGRRIKRAVSIDLRSVRFLDADEIERFEAWATLRDYVSRKRRELEEANTAAQDDRPAPADLRRLTNLGTFRAWIWATLRRHPKIHQSGHTLLVRQLPPGSEGVPIEIYCFTNDTAWVAYEDIQADLFDRILAIVPEFGLRVFQKPSGGDLEALAERGVAGSAAAAIAAAEGGA